METNNVSPDKKDSILKSLAIAGFIAILLIVAWLAIQLVHLSPGAFSSVASLAESVNQNQNTIIDSEVEMGVLTLSNSTSLLNTGETVVVTWSKVSSNGSYAFAYDCIDGVALEHISNTGIRPIECATNYNVGDINSLTLAIDSEKNRYADVPYTISFLRTNDTEPRALGSDTVTVVNTDINNQFTQSEEKDDSVAIETEDTSTNSNESTPGVPSFTQEFTYAIPSSDPNGYTDLGATYVGVGEIMSQSFVPGIVETNSDGAIQFTVKNFGTKTSQNWTFTLELPNGNTYESPTQTALKPNERAVVTIGFPTAAANIHTFELSIDESTDRNSRNDSFSQTVGFAE
jgi:hypothetical protein